MRQTHLRADIEGLRAVAVGTVLLYHAGLPWVPGGFAGVDVFFVISGFLITSLLLREVGSTGRISLVNFYARRIRRLLPAATLVLLVTAGVGWMVLPGSQHHYLAVDVAAATLYVVNWALADRAVDYLAEGALESPLQHYWSLSVEEQYYVVWPLMIIVGVLLSRRFRLRLRPLLFAMIAVVSLVSLGHSILHTASAPATAYFITTTRIWELGIGSLLAFVSLRLGAWLSPRASGLLALAGLTMIAWAAVLFSASTPWPGSAALVPTVGAALVIAAGCAHHETLSGRLLALRPMVWIGGLSYAIYLWHWPLLVLAEVQWPGIRIRHNLLIVVISVLLAWGTKHFVEDPVRFHRRLVPTGRTLGAGALAMTTCIVAALGVQQSILTLDPDANVTGALGLVADRSAPTWSVRSDPERAYTHAGEVTPPPALAPDDAPLKDGCQIGVTEADFRDDCVFGDRDGTTTFAMVGDSKIGQWFPAVEAIAQAEDWRLEVYVKSACVISTTGVSESCADYSRSLFEHFEEHGAPDYALVSVRASSSYDRTVGGFNQSMRRLTRMGTEVVFLADNPNPLSAALYDCVEANPDDFDACSFDREQALTRNGNPVIREAADEVGLPVVDLNPWMCPDARETCPAVIAETLIYRQGSHLTATYVKTLTPMLHRALIGIDVATGPPPSP